MESTLSSSSPDHDELASIYSSLIDEDLFEIKGDSITPYEGFLSEVEDKIKEDENADIGHENLKEVKNKILQKVKRKQVDRKQRRDSIGSINSIGSQGIKRRTSEELGGDANRKKAESSLKSSAIPLATSR